MSEILIGPVQGGPCDGAKEIIAPYSWDGRVGDNKAGAYRWNAFREMWVWKIIIPKPEKDIIRRRVTEGEFKQNAPKTHLRGKQPVDSRDWNSL